MLRLDQPLVFFIVSVLLVLPACATTLNLSSEPIEGVVREEDTNKPVPGAIVIASWQGHVGYTGTICYHVEIAMTDTQGRYRIPAWNKPSPYGDIAQQHSIVKAYKPGYQLAKRYPVNNPLLKSFSGGREERLAYLSRMAVSCSDKKEIEINLLPLYKAFYEEAEGLAVTKDDKLKVLYRLRDVERLELGTEKAWENFRQRERELK